MSDRGQSLLAIARDALVSEVLPGLEGSARYNALMVVRAIAIAEREAEQGAEARHLEMLGMESLLEGASRPEVAADDAKALDAWRRALCLEIRNGRFDAKGPGREALLMHLAFTTENRLRIDNPKALDLLPQGAAPKTKKAT